MWTVTKRRQVLSTKQLYGDEEISRFPPQIRAKPKYNNKNIDAYIDIIVKKVVNKLMDLNDERIGYKCYCGGRYVEGQLYRHCRTKKHQKVDDYPIPRCICRRIIGIGIDHGQKCNDFKEHHYFKCKEYFANI